jgi:sugar-specific transcriptional regulator TrmB
MDEVSWNEKNNPSRSEAVGERDPKKVGQSTSAYAINEDKRTDAEEEGYEDGFKDAKKDMKDALSKMKVSELKAKIKEDIIEILSEQDEEVDVDVEDEVKADVDVDVEDDVAVDAQGDDINIKKKSVKADIEVGLSPVEELVQDSLEAAMKASEQLGNQTLTDQIGNTITYFTREFVVGRNTD